MKLDTSIPRPSKQGASNVPSTARSSPIPTPNQKSKPLKSSISMEGN